MQINEIKWMTLSPANFPCFRCEKQEAKYNVKINLGNKGNLHLSLCAECIKISELELIAEFIPRRKLK